MSIVFSVEDCFYLTLASKDRRFVITVARFLSRGDERTPGTACSRASKRSTKMIGGDTDSNTKARSILIYSALHVETYKLHSSLLFATPSVCAFLAIAMIATTRMHLTRVASSLWIRPRSSMTNALRMLRCIDIQDMYSYRIGYSEFSILSEFSDWIFVYLGEKILLYKFF